MSISPSAEAFRTAEPAPTPAAPTWHECPAARRLAVPKKDELHLAIAEGPQALLALENSWTALHVAAALPHQSMQSYNWLWHWCAHLHDARTERIILLMGRRAGRLVMLWPLLRRRRLGFTTLHWMGAPVTPYCDALVEPGPHAASDLAAAWDYLKRHASADVIALSNIRADAAVGGLFDRLDVRPVREETACSLDLRTVGSWEAFEATQPAKARKNRRRQRRRLEEMGEICFEVASEGERARELLSQALALKRRWMQERSLVSMAFSAPGFDDFVAGASSPDRPTGCRVGCLSSRGKPVAIAAGFVSQGHFALHIIAYDDAVEACAPGSLLFEDMIRHALAEGFTCFDLMWPGNAYKSEWAPTQTPVRNYAVAVTPLGRLYAEIAPRVRSRAKAAYYAMPAAARKVVAALMGRYSVEQRE